MSTNIYRLEANLQKPLLIAIDGPSASGKGTVAKKIARHFGLPFLNTGALYRMAALRVIEQKIDPEIFTKNISENDVEFKNLLNNLTTNISEEDLENEELGSETVGAVASIIAKNILLRQKLFLFQKNFVEKSVAQNGGAVLDGRDIGTVICPEANFKFFITANVEIRAKRRFDQLKNQGKMVDYNEILAQLKKRDEQDLNRANSPLTIAKDAIVIDNGNLTIEEGFLKILNVILSTKNH